MLRRTGVLMSTANRELVHRWFEEVWNKQSEDAIDQMFASDGKCYGFPGPGQVLVGPAKFKEVHRSFIGAFPDIHVTVDDMISQGDKVAVRFSIRGTHHGDHLGVPATHREVRFPAMSFVRCRNGQIVEGWNTVDMHGMLQQIGAAEVKAGVKG